MKLLLFSLNYAPEEIGIGPYSTGVAQAFRDAGHEVRVVCGKPYYPQWNVAKDFRGGLVRSSCEDGIIVHRCAHFVPRSPSGVKRLLHHASFAANSLAPAMREALQWRPDVVMAVAPSLVAAPVAAAAAAAAGAPFWLHVQDLEAEVAQATGLLPADGLGARSALAFERSVLRSADFVTSISPAMCARIEAKLGDGRPVIELRNWADMRNIAPVSRYTPLRLEWGLGERTVALYSGNIANKQGIEHVIDAARSLESRDDFTLVVCGDGPNRVKLEQRASGARNIVFKPLMVRERLSELLATADVFVLPQLAGAADLSLPSKLANMLAAGRPVIATVAPGTGIHDEVAGSGAGLCTEPGNVGALREALEFAIANPEWRVSSGAAARERAVRSWGREALLANFVEFGETLAEQACPVVLAA